MLVNGVGIHPDISQDCLRFFGFRAEYRLTATRYDFRIRTAANSSKNSGGATNK